MEGPLPPSSHHSNPGDGSNDVIPVEPQPLSSPPAPRLAADQTPPSWRVRGDLPSDSPTRGVRGQSVVADAGRVQTLHLLNVRGLKTANQNKVPLINDILHEHAQSSFAFALTETWLGDHLDEELKIPDFRLFRADRTRKKAKRGRSSGGAALYVRNSLASEIAFQLLTS